MLTWHRHYSAAVHPLKRHLSVVVKKFRGRSSAPLGDACRQLAREALTMLSDERVLGCPEENVQYPLRQALSHLRRMAIACNQGQASVVLRELGHAEEQLHFMALLLGWYGLTP